MNSSTLLLAQSASSDGFWGRTTEYLTILFRPSELLDSLGQVPFLLASIVVTVGVLCIFNGYRWHKWVIAVLAFMCGLGLGHVLAQQMGRSMIVAGAIGCLCAIIATPLLRISVFIFGGLTGAFIGANAWGVVNTAPAEGHWAGAMIGFIILAMASLMMFRLVVVLFTAVGGAAMAIFGGITLLMHVPNWEQAIRDSLTENELLIPLLLLVAAVSGFVLQESRLRADGIKILGREGEE